jgi:hypothetical protein
MTSLLYAIESRSTYWRWWTSICLLPLRRTVALFMEMSRGLIFLVTSLGHGRTRPAFPSSQNTMSPHYNTPCI